MADTQTGHLMDHAVRHVDMELKYGQEIAPIQNLQMEE